MKGMLYIYIALSISLQIARSGITLVILYIHDSPLWGTDTVLLRGTIKAALHVKPLSMTVFPC